MLGEGLVLIGENSNGVCTSMKYKGGWYKVIRWFREKCKKFANQQITHEIVDGIIKQFDKVNPSDMMYHGLTSEGRTEAKEFMKKLGYYLSDIGVLASSLFPQYTEADLMRTLRRETFPIHSGIGFYISRWFDHLKQNGESLPEFKPEHFIRGFDGFKNNILSSESDQQVTTDVFDASLVIPITCDSIHLVDNFSDESFITLCEFLTTMKNLVIMLRGIQGVFKSYFGKGLVKEWNLCIIRLGISGLQMVYLDQDMFNRSKPACINAMKQALKNNQIIVLGRMNLDDSQANIVNGLGNLRLLQINLGKNDVVTLFRGLMGVVHRHNQKEIGFSLFGKPTKDVSTTPDVQFGIMKEMLSKWCDLDPKFGPPLYLGTMLDSSSLGEYDPNASVVSTIQRMEDDGILKDGCMSGKTMEKIIPLKIFIDSVMNAMTKPINWGTQKTEEPNQIKSIQNFDPRKVSYFSVVLQSNEVIQLNKASGFISPEGATTKDEYHVTVWFIKPNDRKDSGFTKKFDDMMAYLGQEVEIVLESVQRDEKNAIIACHIIGPLTQLCQNVQCHITLWHDGKASNAGSVKGEGENIYTPSVPITIMGTFIANISKPGGGVVPCMKL
jgi:hypothetical protein